MRTEKPTEVGKDEAESWHPSLPGAGHCAPLSSATGINDSLEKWNRGGPELEDTAQHKNEATARRLEDPPLDKWNGLAGKIYNYSHLEAPPE